MEMFLEAGKKRGGLIIESAPFPAYLVDVALRNKTLLK